MEKVRERAKKYEVTVAPIGKYFKAKLSVNFAGERRRLEGGGKDEELAVLNLLNKLKEHIDNLYCLGKLRTKIGDVFNQKFQKSVLELNLALNSLDITEKFGEIIKKINQVNMAIDNDINFANNVIPFSNHFNMEVIRADDGNIQKSKVERQERHLIEDVAREWRKHEFARTKGTIYNQRMLKRKTLDGYIRIMNNTILPFLKKHRLLYIDQVKENVISDCIASANGYHNKRQLDVVFRLFIDYLVKERILEKDLMSNISKPVKPRLNREKKIRYIEVENQDDYIKAFLKENTDMSILFALQLSCGGRSRRDVWTTMG